MYSNYLRSVFLFITGMLISVISFGQTNWEKVDDLFQPLPSSVHVFKTTSLLDGKPNIAYYVIADLNDKNLVFETDTTYKRRLTLSDFYNKNNHPTVVVNTTFFSFGTNQNLNMVIKNSKLVSYNTHTIIGKGKDTLTYKHPLGSAIGISKKRKADIAWTYTDSASSWVMASQEVVPFFKDSIQLPKKEYFLESIAGSQKKKLKKWEMKTAVGGGPVVLQQGEIKVTNNEEVKFAGKAIADKHPRTAIGYTKENKLIILLIEGRNPGIAEGATLTQEAQLLKELGCYEAMNLDGGGSSCMLVNGKETIKVSDKEGQRPVPSVLIITTKKRNP